MWFFSWKQVDSLQLDLKLLAGRLIIKLNKIPLIAGGLQFAGSLQFQV
jgi:hypothetical protein